VATLNLSKWQNVLLLFQVILYVNGAKRWCSNWGMLDSTYSHDVVFQMTMFLLATRRRSRNISWMIAFFVTRKSDDLRLSKVQDKLHNLMLHLYPVNSTNHANWCNKILNIFGIYNKALFNAECIIFLYSYRFTFSKKQKHLPSWNIWKNRRRHWKNTEKLCA
jgi:hypothetical protein